MTRSVDLTQWAAVILDFDGPMAQAFAGHPASGIANELRELLTHVGWPDEALPTTLDPMQFLHELQQCSSADLAAAEAVLAAAEREAVESAPETAGLGDLLRHLNEAGVPIAVASNNHGPAIERWLDRTGYADRVSHVAGRDPHDPSLMKPHPHVLIQTARALGVEPERCCFVGDSLTDAEAADAAGVAFVAMANKAHKHQLFSDHGCRDIISALGELMSPSGRVGPSNVASSRGANG